MENFLIKQQPNPYFPGRVFYTHKDSFVYSDHLGGPEFWQKHGNNFEARESDVFIASFPRTGLTWTSEIVYLLAHDLDFENARTVTSTKRIPYFCFPETPDDAFVFKSPRCIRTHIPHAHLPTSIKEKKCKIIYTLRNPKDVIASYYVFGKNNKFVNFVGDFNILVELFTSGQLPGGPFWKHVLEYWNHRNEDNFLMVVYEDTKKDVGKQIRRIAKFFGKDFTENQVQSVAEHCSFDAMKSNPTVNLKDYATRKNEFQFIRKGEVGDWRNYFSTEQSELMDEHVREHFTGSGLDFIYE